MLKPWVRESLYESLGEKVRCGVCERRCIINEGEKGFYNCYVSNGYQSLEALRLLKKAGMDAINIDIKGNGEVYEKYCFDIDVNKIWRNIKEVKNLGIHVEVVNLVITDVNDSEGSVKEIIDEHLKNAGEKTPLHFTRYYPSYKFENPPTKISTLERAYEMAKEAGILYPYIGNVPGHPYENTYCHNCGELLIERHGYLHLIKKKIDKCPICGEEIPIAWSKTFYQKP